MTKICYFSGTGNTLWSAQEIARLTGGENELLNIGMLAHKDPISLEADAVIILFPSYAFGLPLVVSRFLQKCEFKTPYIAALVTYGSNPGGSLAAAARILKKKCIRTVYYGSIPAVENYIPIFGVQQERTKHKRLIMQKDATVLAAHCIAERKINRINTFRPFSGLISSLFCLGLKVFFKYYRLSDSCNGCGICQTICPVSAVTMQDNRPVFSPACEHCQGCFNWCPQKAINFGRLKPATPRYHHPEITLSEITPKC